MRFRLATGGTGGQQLGDGVGNLFRSLAMAPLYQAQGAEDAQSAEQKRRLQQSQIDAETTRQQNNLQHDTRTRMMEILDSKIPDPEPTP